MSRSQKADEIRLQMQQLRFDLDDDVGEIVEQAQVMSDWRYYVRSYPWVCIALAAAVGYLLVPRRLNLLSPDPKTLLELAKQHRLVVEAKPEPQASGGLAVAALTLLSRTLLREAMSVAGEHAKGFFQAEGRQASRQVK